MRLILISFTGRVFFHNFFPTIGTTSEYNLSVGAKPIFARVVAFLNLHEIAQTLGRVEVRVPRRWTNPATAWIGATTVVQVTKRRIKYAHHTRFLR